VGLKAFLISDFPHASLSTNSCRTAALVEFAADVGFAINFVAQSDHVGVTTIVFHWYYFDKLKQFLFSVIHGVHFILNVFYIIKFNVCI
jgi:hypothetical protein